MKKHKIVMAEGTNSEISKTRKVIGSSMFILGAFLFFAWIGGCTSYNSLADMGIDDAFTRKYGSTISFIGSILLMMIGGGMAFGTEPAEPESPESESEK